jgi:predicted transcriptional regulator
MVNSMSEMTTVDIKAAAHALIDALPANATWDDVMQQVYVRQCVEAGLRDAQAGKVVSVEEVRRQFGLSS